MQQLVFEQVAIFLAFTAIGYGLKKLGVMDDSAKVVLSKLETYVFIPASIL